MIPTLENGRLLFDGRPFFALAGELHNSSSSNLDYMASIWPRLREMNLNTVLAPISWELIEPEEGVFDWTLVDGLIGDARFYGMKLVPLWFGAYKNGESTYAPAWVKSNRKRFPRAELTSGVPTRTLSHFSQEVAQADARAFASLMGHIRECDEDGTVIMVQVENETGLLGASRDHSKVAEDAFCQPVPGSLIKALRKGSVVPELLQGWSGIEGTWKDTFGDKADEVFMAWHVASFVETVTAAGKKEHPLPMFANAWLVNHADERPGQYPSGGPLPLVMDVWRLAAPSIDCLAPDIYSPTVRETCAAYTRQGNPLVIPEIHPMRGAAAAFYAFAQHDAILFAPFAIDGSSDFSGLKESYRLLGELTPVILEHRGAMAGILQEGGYGKEFELGGYGFHANYNDHSIDYKARGLLIALGDDEFLLAGSGFSLRVLPPEGEDVRIDFHFIEEGGYIGAEWKPGRRLNGDEYNLALGGELECRRFKVYRY